MLFYQNNRRGNFIKIYIPETYEIMPQKKIYLLRAGFNGSKFQINDKLKEEVNKIYKLGLELAQPKAVGDTYKIETVPTELIPRSFEGVKSITFFVSTLGYEIDNYISNANTLSSMLMDAWASEAIEAFNESIDKKLRKDFGKGTRRFSPGYSDIDVRKNWDIVSNLLKIEIVVINKETGIITPRKSTVCMIGWYDE